MPKDATKNVDRYKVRGGHLNEYDFEKQKAAEKKAADKNPKSTDMKPQQATAHRGPQKATKKGPQKATAQKARKKK